MKKLALIGLCFCLVKMGLPVQAQTLSLDDAIRIANDSRYGLACSIYSQDETAASSAARNIRSGGVAINSAGVSLTQPFGGYKQSGWGRECGPEGILEFTQLKQVISG